MKNQNKHMPNNADLEKMLDQFPDEERTRIEKIWRQSKKDRRHRSITSDKETEEALQKVHFRIQETEQSDKRKSNIAGFILSNARYLVAAVALFVLGFGILWVPKTVTVPNAEIAVVELPDGSSVEMNSGSTIQYNRLFPFTNRTVTLNGEAYFSVQQDEETFIVKANGSAVEVTGTEFNIRSWADDPGSETTVTVTEGDVQFYPEGRKRNHVFLTAGQTSRLRPKMNSPSQSAEASADEDLAWRENRMIFHETPLIVILQDLERGFDVNIELDVENMEYETLTAYYNHPANLETILEDICTVKGLRYTKTTNGYRIFK